MASRTQSLDEALRTGISLPTRTIYIVGCIDEEKFKLVHLGLDLLDGEGLTTTIILSSEGGCISDGLAIYDAIKACVGNVRIIGTGVVQSMAPVVLQAGDERLLTPNARLHLHEASADMSRATLSSLVRTLEDQQRQDALTWGILADSTGLSVTALKERFSQNTYFSATEAIELGLADSLV